VAPLLLSGCATTCLQPAKADVASAAHPHPRKPAVALRRGDALRAENAGNAAALRRAQAAAGVPADRHILAIDATGSAKPFAERGPTSTAVASVIRRAAL
jgi:hypothetical protein